MDSGLGIRGCLTSSSVAISVEWFTLNVGRHTLCNPLRRRPVPILVIRRIGMFRLEMKHFELGECRLFHGRENLSWE